MSNVEAIKKALEEVGPLKVEFTPDCDDFNSIIAPINADYDGTYFTVIGCGEKQDKLGTFMASAVNAVPEILTTLEALQRENEELRKAAKARQSELCQMLTRTEENVVSQIRRAVLAENEEKRLREALTGLVEDLEARSVNGTVNCSHGVYCTARQALASAGEEHHADK